MFQLIYAKENCAVFALNGIDLDEAPDDQVRVVSVSPNGYVVYADGAEKEVAVWEGGGSPEDTDRMLAWGEKIKGLIALASTGEESAIDELTAQIQ